MRSIGSVGPVLLLCRLVLAGVFAGAGVAKLLDRSGSRRAVVEFGVPERLAGPVSVIVPLAEITAAVALVPLATARFGALLAAVLLSCFSVAIANALAHGRTPDCHCFGQVHSAPASVSMLARNLLLLGVALFVAIAGWHDAGVSATHWVTTVSAAWLVAIAAGVVIVALISFQTWFSLQLLSQNGRTIRRLEALEAALHEIAGASERPLATDTAARGSGGLGEGLRGGGLAVGSPGAFVRARPRRRRT